MMDPHEQGGYVPNLKKPAIPEKRKERQQADFPAHRLLNAVVEARAGGSHTILFSGTLAISTSYGIIPSYTILYYTIR